MNTMAEKELAVCDECGSLFLKGEVCAVYVRFIDIEASYREQE